MSNKDKANQAARRSSSLDDDQPASGATKSEDDDDRQELLPSDMNESADISPRIAFLAYN